jgi:hypothetical protein
MTEHTHRVTSGYAEGLNNKILFGVPPSVWFQGQRLPEYDDLFNPRKLNLLSYGIEEKLLRTIFSDVSTDFYLSCENNLIDQRHLVENLGIDSIRYANIAFEEI